jgi:diguanylate cyclase (GGDEF)-like protein
MDPTTLLSLMLPAMMAVFAGAFLVVSRYGLPAARGWGLGLCFSALGFANPFLISDPTVAALLSDLFFIVAFYFYSGAYLCHFEMPAHRRERLAFSAIYMIMNLYVVAKVGNLQLELLLNDIATSCLMGFALVSTAPRARSTAERALVVAGSVVVLDSLVRVMLFVFLTGTDLDLKDFVGSSYAAAMQITTSVIGTLYILAIAFALADRVISQLKDAAERDPLTGLLNRRGFDRAFSELQNDGRLAGAVLTCDIDHFKAINDGFGHAAGDGVIKGLAEELELALGHACLISRFGGEEFVVFAPGRRLGEAGVAAQSVRIRFAARDWRELGIDAQITVSFGVAVVADNEYSIDRALARADACLYAAKEAGRNQVVLEGGRFELKPLPEPDPASNVVILRRILN